MDRRQLLAGLGLFSAGVGIGYGSRLFLAGGDLWATGSRRPGAALADMAGDERLAPGARILLIGDSIIAAGNYISEDADYWSLVNSANGEAIWAFMLDPRFRYDVWGVPDGRVTDRRLLHDGANQGVVGSKSLRLVDSAEINHIRQLDPDLVVVAFGANDIPLQTSFKVFSERLRSFCDLMIHEDRRRIIVGLVRPHAAIVQSNPLYAFEPDDPKWAVHKAINDFIAGELPGLYPSGTLAVWDNFTPLADPSSPNSGYFLPGMTRDGVHLTDLAAYRSGLRLRQAIAGMVKPGLFFDPQPTRGNLIPNPRLVGSGGVAGPGVSGPLPRDISLRSASGDGANVAVTREPDGEFAGDRLVMEFGNPAERVFHEFQLFFHAARYIPLPSAKPGWVQAYVPVAVEPFDGLAGITLFLANENFSRFTEGLRPLNANEANWPRERFEGWLITPAMEVRADISGLRVGIRMRYTSGLGRRRIAIRPNIILRAVEAPMSVGS